MDITLSRCLVDVQQAVLVTELFIILQSMPSLLTIHIHKKLVEDIIFLFKFPFVPMRGRLTQA